MFTNLLVALAPLLALTSAVPSHPLLHRATNGMVGGVPADPVQFSGRRISGPAGYVNYNGDGSEGQGWPNRQSWINFDNMFDLNRNLMMNSCGWMGVPNTSPSEANDIKAGIQQASDWSRVDPRFILAIMMQESKGCVRVHTTGNGVRNPGLMQDHDGQHSCNDNGFVQNPCPKDQITYMISDGAGGTPAGDGLSHLINRAAGNTGTQSAWPFYKAARMYNSGSIAASADLNNANGATGSYVRDIANRLQGWVGN